MSRLLEDAVRELSRLPGIGRRTALRLAMHILRSREDDVAQMVRAIGEFRTGIRHCVRCNNLSDNELCDICNDPTRDRSIICVVEQVGDVLSIEKTGQFRGLYHVLGGVISPMAGIAPGDLKIDLLIDNIMGGDSTRDDANCLIINANIPTNKTTAGENKGGTNNRNESEMSWASGGNGAGNWNVYGEGGEGGPSTTSPSPSSSSSPSPSQSQSPGLNPGPSSSPSPGQSLSLNPSPSLNPGPSPSQSSSSSSSSSSSPSPGQSPSPGSHHPKVREVILAISTTVEGETTLFYILNRLRAYKDLKITTIARGIGFGDEIEYADELTISHAIANRRELSREP